MFKDFGRRLERDVRRSVDGRLKVTEQLSAGRIKVSWTVQFYLVRFQLHSAVRTSCQTFQSTDKRPDVWSRDFILWKINFGLWPGLDCGIKGSGLIMSNFWGQFFHFFGVKNFFVEKTEASELKSCINWSYFFSRFSLFYELPIPQ